MAEIAQLVGVPQPDTKLTFYQQRAARANRNKVSAFATSFLDENPEFKVDTATTDVNVSSKNVFKAEADTKAGIDINAGSFKAETDTKALNTKAVTKNNSTKVQPIPLHLVEALQHVTKGNPLPPKPNGPLGHNVRVGLDQVVATLNAYFPPPKAPRPGRTPLLTIKDIVNDLAIANWTRIFAAANDTTKLQAIATELQLPVPTMAGRLPVLSTSDLPTASTSEASATASPARGTAMLNSIFKSVRVPEFRFRWMFWAEKGQQSTPGGGKSTAGGAEEYASRPKALSDQIVSIKDFYQYYNNIPMESLKLRDSIHLFHMGVKPVWEDPRNTRGGAWYFRIPKENAKGFWHEICLLAVGDILQGAVETKRDGMLLFPFPSPFSPQPSSHKLDDRFFFTDIFQQPSTTTSAASRTASAGTRSRLPSGPATQTTKLEKRSCLLPSWRN
jgi:hypothetical protein